MDSSASVAGVGAVIATMASVHQFDQARSYSDDAVRLTADAKFAATASTWPGTLPGFTPRAWANTAVARPGHYLNQALHAAHGLGATEGASYLRHASTQLHRASAASYASAALPRMLGTVAALAAVGLGSIMVHGFATSGSAPR
jgi:hypothetical protein